jgi:hypothetical protein
VHEVRHLLGERIALGVEDGLLVLADDAPADQFDYKIRLDRSLGIQKEAHGPNSRKRPAEPYASKPHDGAVPGSI